MLKYLLLISLTLIASCGAPDTPVTPQVGNTQKTILALGDSLTAGYGLSVTDSYPSQLEARFREKSYNYRIINA